MLYVGLLHEFCEFVHLFEFLFLKEKDPIFKMIAESDANELKVALGSFTI
jgi:hypothetical protein